MKPLNGEKTHPLTEHAIDVLRSLHVAPMPRQKINPGVANRLLREKLVLSVQLISPYKTHKKNLIEHLVISHAGRVAIGEAMPVEPIK